MPESVFSRPKMKTSNKAVTKSISLKNDYISMLKLTNLKISTYNSHFNFEFFQNSMKCNANIYFS